eukprot:4402367-Pyramimonas_sp.AAC.3
MRLLPLLNAKKTEMGSRPPHGPFIPLFPCLGERPYKTVARQPSPAVSAMTRQRLPVDYTSFIVRGASLFLTTRSPRGEVDVLNVQDVVS